MCVQITMLYFPALPFARGRVGVVDMQDCQQTLRQEVMSQLLNKV